MLLNMVAQMWNEVKVLANLSHPNVVKYYDCFADSDERLVIVMEYCDVCIPFLVFPFQHAPFRWLVDRFTFVFLPSFLALRHTILTIKRGRGCGRRPFKCSPAYWLCSAFSMSCITISYRITRQRQR